MIKEMMMSALVATVPAHQWVTLKNIDPIHSANRTLTFGETCSIAEGGKLSVITDSTENTYLVRYEAPGDVGGAQCPSGGIFEISKTEFSTMTERYEANATAERSEIDRIRALLK